MLLAQERQLAVVLDAFGHALQLQVARDHQDGLHQHAPARSAIQIGDEAAVDLQTIQRQALEVGQRRVAGTKIVDGEAHALCLELLHVADGMPAASVTLGITQRLQRRLGTLISEQETTIAPQRLLGAVPGDLAEGGVAVDQRQIGLARAGNGHAQGLASIARLARASCCCICALRASA